MRHRNPLVIATVLLLGLALGGCGSMDPADWFNPKKPLPGERTAVFPSGVPGVPQGVPPELVQGYQPPPEPPPQVAEAPPEPPKPKPVAKPKPKPKPKQVTAPARPTAITVQSPQQATTQSARPAPRQAGTQPAPSPAPGQPAAQSAPWPAPQQTASQPAQPQSQSPFPDPPPAGTFSR